MPEADRVERRRQHHPRNAGVARRTHHPHRALPRRDDHVVLVVDRTQVHGRGDVQHAVHPADGLRPAGVAEEVGRHERQRLLVRHTGSSQTRTRGLLPVVRPDGGAHLVSAVEELQDDVPGDEAGAAGDEEALTGHGPSFREVEC